MVEVPGIRLVIEPAPTLSASGPLRDRAIGFARSWAGHQNGGKPPRCHIRIATAPRDHIGLGTGTQTALAVAAGLDAFYGRPSVSPAVLAENVGRGRRSAVGTYGFVRGGLILEPGKLPDDRLAPLGQRVAVPGPWRFVLICPPDRAGRSGTHEQRAFEQLPPVPPQVTDQLWRELTEQLIPAAEAARFDDFSESLYRYGVTAGQCFAAVQGGPFASPQLTQRVALIRRLGIAGVGQSSWGPTLFAVAAGQDEAEEFVARFRRESPDGPLDITVSAPRNSAAHIERVETPSCI
jgi:beta-RFAP synthase